MLSHALQMFQKVKAWMECWHCALSWLMADCAGCVVQAKKAQVGTTTTKRRDKMTKEELEAQLFVLFGQQQHWHFTQIQVRLHTDTGAPAGPCAAPSAARRAPWPRCINPLAAAPCQASCCDCNS